MEGVLGDGRDVVVDFRPSPTSPNALVSSGKSLPEQREGCFSKASLLDKLDEDREVKTSLIPLSLLYRSPVPPSS